MNKPLTIRHIRLFVAVAETGSMCAAATKLYVAQPTISQSIKELETGYGVRLFERYGKRLHITETGQALLPKAKQVLASFDQLEAEVSPKRFHERIRIGATMTVGSCLLAQLVKSLNVRFPETETYSRVANTQTIENLLLKSDLDIGVVEGEIESPYLVSEPIIEDFLVIACSQPHPFARIRRLPVRLLEHQAFVMREKGSGTRALFEAFLRRQKIDIRVIWEATCPEAIRAAMLDCGCLSAISVRLIERDIREGRLHVICNPTREWDRTFNFVYHRDKRLSPAMKAIREIMQSFRRPHFLDETKCATLSGTNASKRCRS